MKSLVLVKVKKCLAVVLFTAGVLALSFGGYHALPAKEPTQKSDAKAIPPAKKPAQAAPRLDWFERPVRYLTLPECIAIALENITMPDDNADNADSLGTRDNTLPSLKREQVVRAFAIALLLCTNSWGFSGRRLCVSIIAPPVLGRAQSIMKRILTPPRTPNSAPATVAPPPAACLCGPRGSPPGPS